MHEQYTSEYAEIKALQGQIATLKARIGAILADLPPLVVVRRINSSGLVTFTRLKYNHPRDGTFTTNIDQAWVYRSVNDAQFALECARDADSWRKSVTYSLELLSDHVKTAQISPSCPSVGWVRGKYQVSITIDSRAIL